MPKTRQPIPRIIRDKVLKEYNHRCAICGGDRPQLHHIDEDPANNDPFNLIPLCPNCHLTDQHDPTKLIDRRKLGLFRVYKDPIILKPHFDPLFRRMIFLDSIAETADFVDLFNRVQELIGFVHAVKMGDFYAERLTDLLKVPDYGFVPMTFVGGSRAENKAESARREQEREERDAAYRQHLCQARDQAYSLCVELLRFQDW